MSPILEFPVEKAPAPFLTVYLVAMLFDIVHAVLTSKSSADTSAYVLLEPVSPILVKVIAHDNNKANTLFFFTIIVTSLKFFHF